MYEKHSRKLRQYFSTWPALPLLDVLTLHIALQPFRDVRLGNRTLLAFLNQKVILAEIELLQVCEFADVGDQLLLSNESTVRVAIQVCYEQGFPETKKACAEIHQVVKGLPQVPLFMHPPEDIGPQCVYTLRRLAEHFVRPCPGFKIKPSIWTADEWEMYFNDFPYDEFRIPVLHAAQHLAKHAPEIFTPRLKRLFRCFFDDTFRDNGLKWDEYEDTEKHDEKTEEGDASAEA